MEVLSIKDYIKQKVGDVHGAKAKFANGIGKSPQQVNKWLSKNWYVVINDVTEEHILMSPQQLLKYSPKVKLEELFIMNNTALLSIYDNEEPVIVKSIILDLNVDTGRIFVIPQYETGAKEDLVSAKKGHIQFTFTSKDPIKLLLERSDLKQFIKANTESFDQLLWAYHTLERDNVKSVEAFRDTLELMQLKIDACFNSESLKV